MFRLLKKNKNYKLVIGLIVGFIFSSAVVVYAWYNDYANEVSYDPSNTWLHSTTVQGALDELARQKGCPVGYSCLDKKFNFDVGDYVSYTPVKTSFTTDTAYTGDWDSQTINPSELDSWRVISVNQDGTADLISEYTSNECIYFRGQTGYQNLVGYLNVLASQYETTGITVGSRHYGYNGQTEFITNTQYFVNPAPWTCSTGSTCNPDPDDYEEYGGGDTLYLTDYDLVYTAFGTRQGMKMDGTTSEYWMASREYYYFSGSSYNWKARYMMNNNSSTSSLYINPSQSNPSSRFCKTIRPIVTISSEVSVSGIGTKELPMEIN